MVLLLFKDKIGTSIKTDLAACLMNSGLAMINYIESP